LFSILFVVCRFNTEKYLTHCTACNLSCRRVSVQYIKEAMHKICNEKDQKGWEEEKVEVKTDRR